MALAYNARMSTPLDAAKYLLSKQVHGNRISNMKLLKLLYFAHGYCLAVFNRPLFKENFEAWQHGPVIPEVYAAYKKHASHEIPIEHNPPELEEFVAKSLDEAFARWGGLTASQLRDIAHSAPPWREAYYCHGEGAEIDTNDIYQFFIEKMSIEGMDKAEFTKRFEDGIRMR
jgi:uncharacterized phage-associated protein